MKSVYISLNPAKYFPWVYIALLIPLLFLSRDMSTGKSSGDVNFIPAGIIYLIMFLCAFRRLNPDPDNKLFFHPSDMALILVITVLAAQILYTQNTLIFFNAVFFIMVAVTIRSASLRDDFFEHLNTASTYVLSFMIFSLIFLGPVQDRWIGGMHPNNFAGIAVSAVILSMFGSVRKFEIVTAISIFFSILVSSRYAIVSIAISFVFYWAMNMRRAGSVRIAFVSVSLFLFVIHELYQAQNGIIYNILELGDAHRGLSSGISGRDEMWAHFAPQIFERPLLGYGFRMRDAYLPVHNGFLATILEVGIIAAFGIFSYMLLRLKIFFTSCRDVDPTVIRGRFVAATLAITFAALLQPQLFSFGETFGLTSLIILFSHSKCEIWFSECKRRKPIAVS